MGDFRFSPLLLKLGKDMPAPAKEAMDDTGLQGASWNAHTLIASDGSRQIAAAEIDGWNWREAIKKLTGDAEKAGSHKGE